MDPWRVTDLDAIPRLGWVTEPSPVTKHAEIAERLGAGGLWIKRDDQLDALRGGTKPRKLDYLLATEPYASAPGWHAVGAIGSGQLVATVAAAAALGRRAYAHAFWEPPSAGILDNLAFIATGADALRYYRGRVTMAVRRPSLMTSRSGGQPVIPPGATSPDGTLGIVRAALELGEQIRGGQLPVPERVYVALGSGGTAAGLAVGLGLAGIETELRAVATVERPLSPDARLRSLIAQTYARLSRVSSLAPRLAGAEPIPWRIDRRHLGRGYGKKTSAGDDAQALFAPEDVPLECVYTAKAMASLIDDAATGALGSALFWMTAHRGPLPHDDDWQSRLPAALARRLEEPRGFSRRKLLVVGGAAAAVGSLTFARIAGYERWPNWRGQVLAVWEAQVIRAASEAILPHATAQQLDAIPMAVDRFLRTMPSGLVLEIHGLIGLMEHGTTPLGLRLSRLTALPPAERATFFAGLAAHGGLLAQAGRGLRDLCLMGFYQQRSSWGALGYEGPRVPDDAHPSTDGRMVWATYEALEANPGDLPGGASR